MEVRRRNGGLIGRHWVFVLLLMALVWHCSQTFGVYVRADDFGWVERSAADAGQPWNVFGAPVFGSYCRPVVNAIWLANWYVWGFNFHGYQLSLCLLWLAGIVLVYGVGCKLGGRVAGFMAAALLGLNDIHLLLVTWKSWFTALSEIALLAGWLWCFVLWVEGRERKFLLGWVALAVLGMMAKESAPLIVSGGVFITLVWPRFFGGKRAALWLGVWAAVSAGALLLMPAYRGMFASVFSGGEAQVGERAFALAHFTKQFPFHSGSMLGYGISRGLLMFALVMNGWRALRMHTRLGDRHFRVLLGALIIGAGVVWLPAGVAIWGEAGRAFAYHWLWPAVAGLLFCGFVVIGAAGDRWDRVLTVWFVAAMTAILFFYKKTNAYHMLAFVALALYTGRAVALFAADAVRPAWLRLRGRLKPGLQDGARLAVVVVFALMCVQQGWMLARNFQMLHFGRELIPRRVASGEAARVAVRHAVGGVLADAAPDKRVWIARDEFERMVALELRVRHGFTVADWRQREGDWVGLRRFDSRLRVYTDAIRFDRDLFARHNGLAQGGATKGVLQADGDALGDDAFAARVAAGQQRNLQNDSSPFGLAPGAAVVFGGFMRNETARARRVCMAMLSEDGKSYAVRTPSVHKSKGEWILVWECAAPAGGEGRFKFRVIEALGVTDGAVYADDVFICPVGPLIKQARAGIQVSR